MDGRAFLLIVIVGLGACGGTPPASQSHFQVDTLPSGLVQVTNDGVGLWTPETAWTLEEDLRLGTVDGGGPEQFSQVAYILEDDEDRIFILDFPAQDVRVFSSAGEFSHTIGRQGQGPGELTRAAGLDWGPDGRLWVWAGGRYSVFEKSGDFVTSYNRHVQGVIYPWNGGFVPGGRYIDWGLEREVIGRERVGDYLVTTYTGLTSFYPIEFTPPDRLDTLPPLEFYAETTGEGTLKIGRKSLMLAQADDGYVWFAHSDEYRVFKRTIDGDTLLVFGIPGKPMPVPISEMDSIIRASAASPGPSRRRDREDFVAHRRLVTRVLTDNAGHIYVLPQEEGLEQGLTVDVFEESGVYLGRMEFGEKVRTLGPPPYVTRDHVYAVVNDEFDVPFVVRWRIVRP